MTQRRFAAAELEATAVRLEDVEALRDFRCSLGTEWEQEVEDEIQQRLARRYLDWGGGEADPRMIVVRDKATEQILGVAAHFTEPVQIADDAAGEDPVVTYLEVVAISLDARRTTVHVGDGGEPMSFGEFVYELALQDIRSRGGRLPLVFARVDRRHEISLAFCDRVGLNLERENAGTSKYIQRWAKI